MSDSKYYYQAPNVRLNQSITIAFALLLLVSQINFGVLLGLQKEYYWLFSSFILFLLACYFANNGEICVGKSIIVSAFVLLTIIILALVRAGVGNFPSSVLFIINVVILPWAAYGIGFVVGWARYLRSIRIAYVVLCCLSLILWVTSGVSLSDDYSPLQASASIFGAIMSGAALIFFIMWKIEKNRIDLWLCGSSFLLLIISHHRAGLVALLLSSCVYIFLKSKRSLWKKSISVVVICCLIISILIGIYVYFPSMIQSWFKGGQASLLSPEAFFDSIQSAGRFLVWGAMIDSLLNDWSLLFFGGGIGNSIHYIQHNLPETLGSIALPHNEYLRIMFDLGLVGLTAYGFYIARIFYSKVFFLDVAFVSAVLFHIVGEMFFSNVLYMAGSYMFLMFGFVGAIHNGGAAKYSLLIPFLAPSKTSRMDT